MSSNSNDDNYYSILEIDKNASPEEIKKKFRKLSLKYHPDKGGDINKFHKLQEAYSTLSDPQKRKMYDLIGSSSSPFNFANVGAGGGGGFTRVHINPDNIHQMFGNINEDDIQNIIGSILGGNNKGGVGGLFNMMFTKPQKQRQSPQGIPSFISQILKQTHNAREKENVVEKPSNINIDISISLNDAYSGLSYPLEIKREIKKNNGSTEYEKETIYVEIQKGIDSGEIITIENKGNCVEHPLYNEDMIYSNVKVTVNVNNETIFKRMGMDLIYMRDISLKEALTGFQFAITHLNGKNLLLSRNKEIVKPNMRTMLKGYGMERGEKKGNLIIHFNIIFPDTLSDEIIDFLKEKL